VSSIDLMSRKDDAHAGGLITCWPINSSKVKGKDDDLRKKVTLISLASIIWLWNHFLNNSVSTSLCAQNEVKIPIIY